MALETPMSSGTCLSISAHLADWLALVPSNCVTSIVESSVWCKNVEPSPSQKHTAHLERWILLPSFLSYLQVAGHNHFGAGGRPEEQLHLQLRVSVLRVPQFIVVCH